MIKLRKPQVVYCLHYLCVRRMFQGGGSSFMSKWTFHERRVIIVCISPAGLLVCFSPTGLCFHHLVCVSGGRILGKSSVEDMCLSGSSISNSFGPVRNPCDETRITGGSSSGSAALVSSSCSK